jgi:uncharacterized protein
MVSGTEVIGRLLETLTLDGAVADGEVTDVRMGPLWTAVTVQTAGGPRAGLASTQLAHDLEHGRPAVRDAGRLIGTRARQLAALAAAEDATLTERSLGFAALNALIEVDAAAYSEGNAEERILAHGTGRRVAIVGHFPFVPRVRAAAGECWVLELSPGTGDLPADRAPEVIPQADVVAITGMTLVNGTFGPLAALCRSDAYVLVLGATTPLSPVLFAYGVANISGVVVDDIPAVLTSVSQGANFRQIKGKRLVMMERR